MDYTTLITGEHQGAPKFMALVGLTAEAISDTIALLQNFSNLFDLDQAVGAQLDIIGLWVGISRVVPNVLTIPYFGFSDNPNSLTFGELTNPSAGGPFWNIGESFANSQTILNDDQYRQLLNAQILTNQSDGTAANLARVAEDITGAPCWLTDPGNLSITLHVGAPVNQLAAAMIGPLEVLPVPAGVILNPVDYTNIPLSGAAEADSVGSGTL